MFLKRETVGLAEMERPFEAFQEAAGPAKTLPAQAKPAEKELATSK
ncbi:hypothetical protein GCM10025734_51060 [Kitasatospora paranensis]